MSYGGASYAGISYAGAAGAGSGHGVSETALTSDSVLASRADEAVAETALTDDAVASSVRNLAETALTDDSVAATGYVGHLFVAETALTDDSIFTGNAVVTGQVTLRNRVRSRAAGSVVPDRPGTAPGPSGLHDYEVIVCDKYGVAYGQINSAVPTQVDKTLNGVAQCLIDFYILDPSASALLPPGDIPAVREIQVWRDGQLIWWGYPVNATFDAKQVHLTCQNHLWILGQRSFGPIVTNWLTNPDFEVINLTPVLIDAWETIDNTTPGPPTALIAQCLSPATTPGWQVLTGTQSVGLSQPVAGADSYIRQYVTVADTGSIGLLFDLSAWVYIENANYATAFDQNGIFMQWIVAETVVAGPVVQQITADTGAGNWVRLDCQLELPPNQSGVIEVRLYAVQGFCWWDSCRLTVPESVGSPPWGADVQFIIGQVLDYAMDPTRGKSDEALPFAGPPTGVTLIRDYQFYDNAGILDALNEFPTIGVCDFEVTWDATGHYRWFEIFPPAKGSFKYNYPIEIDLGSITDLQGSVDGSQTATTSRYLGQGSTGSSQDMGYAAFPCLLGGRSSFDGVLAQGSTTITSGGLGFTAADVGKGVYCAIGGAIPIGTVISSVTDSAHAVMSNPAGLNLAGVLVGVGGIVLDNVQSGLPDQPITTLQQSATNYVQRMCQGQILPTSKQRADGPRGLFGNVDTGDIIPVVFNYGWLQLGPVMMRVNATSLYPPTEEFELQLVPVPLPEQAY